MKVLVVSSVFPRQQNDPEVPWLRESLLQLRAQGVDVEVLAPSWRGLQSHKIDGITVHRFRYAPAKWEWLTHDEGAPTKVAKNFGMRIVAAAYIALGTVALLRQVRRNRYDLIHAHWPFPHALMALPARLLFKVPLVLNFHGAELLLVKKFPWVAPFLRLVIGRATGIVANSSFTASRIRAIRPCEVSVIPYGSPLTAPPQLAEPFAEEPWRLLFVGRHIERKGISYLIDAMEELAEPWRWQLRIVGEGDLTNSLQQYAARGSQSSQIVFTGRLSTEELQEEYRRASIFVLPAIIDSKGDTEGLGVVLIEAVVAGVSLVASGVGGIVDVVRHRETGLLVEEKEPKQLAEAFETLASNGELRTKMVENARTHCAHYYSWEVVTRQMVSLYQLALSSRR